MAEYSYQDLMKMQNDAIRRAEDMQRRARQSAGLERGKEENQQNQAAKKEEPRRVPMPNDYLENLKHYGSNSSKNEIVLSVTNLRMELGNREDGEFTAEHTVFMTPILTPGDAVLLECSERNISKLRLSYDSNGMTQSFYFTPSADHYAILPAE